jgi:hypothetical protein
MFILLGTIKNKITLQKSFEYEEERGEEASMKM